LEISVSAIGSQKSHIGRSLENGSAFYTAHKLSSWLLDNFHCQVPRHLLDRTGVQLQKAGVITTAKQCPLCTARMALVKVYIPTWEDVGQH